MISNGPGVCIVGAICLGPNHCSWTRSRNHMLAASVALKERHMLERSNCLLIPRCLPVPKSQKIVNLALSPAMILIRDRLDVGIDADVTNKKFRALDKVSYLINTPPAETT
jgi:hypothetical protein